MPLLDDEQVRLNVDRLPIEFDEYGFDQFGVSKKHLIRFYSALAYFYRHYLKVTSFGMEAIPERGRALIVGNHSGGIGTDAGMVMASLMLNDRAPRLAHGMAEYFLTRSPFSAPIMNRLGHLTGLPEHGERLLKAGRVVVVFPEGARGAGKLYKDRYQLTDFGTGFMRLALKTGTPIIPFAFIGGEETFPQLFHIKWLAKLVKGPFVPVAPQLVLFPLPIACQIYYGLPMHFEGSGSESDDLIKEYVTQVREEVEKLISRGLANRPAAFTFERMPNAEQPSR